MTTPTTQRASTSHNAPTSDRSRDTYLNPENADRQRGRGRGTKPTADRTTASARSANIRHSILEHAAASFLREGYHATTVAGIGTSAGLSKAVVSGHFRTKEQLARDIIEEGFTRLSTRNSHHLESRNPALETLITVSHILVDPRHHDLFESAAHHLIAEVGNFLGSAPVIFRSWRSTFHELIVRAVVEHDIRDTVNTTELAQLLLSTVYGTRIVAAPMTTDPAACARQLAIAWRNLLPALVTDHQIAYFGEFIARRLAALEKSSALARRPSRQGSSDEDGGVQLT